MCHEDRAFLCRGCDISIHSANEFVAKHQRFLFSGVGLALASVGKGGKSGDLSTPLVVESRRENSSANLAQMGAPQNSMGQQNGQNLKSNGKGKRKANALKENSFESEDALVPSMNGMGPSSSGGSGHHHAPLPDDEFNSFVADFVKGGAAADADFLDTFFDDIPAGFREEDFGVVPTFR